MSSGSPPACATGAVVIDAELRSLVRPLDEHEFAALESGVLRDGILAPLLVWDHGGQHVLVDGHHRYELARKHGLDFDVERIELKGRDDATAWIAQHQLGRRNLAPYARAELALALEDELKEQA